MYIYIYIHTHNNNVHRAPCTIHHGGLSTSERHDERPTIKLLGADSLRLRFGMFGLLDSLRVLRDRPIHFLHISYTRKQPCVRAYYAQTRV